MISTVVWGDGSIARDAIRGVHAHPGLVLAGVVTADPAHVGLDAGRVARTGREFGVLATDDGAAVLAERVHAVIYAGSGRAGSAAARSDVVAALRCGAVVLTPSIHPLYGHSGRLPLVHSDIRSAIADGGGSLVVVDTEPDWASHVLPLVLGAVQAGATSVHCGEVVDYSGHDTARSIRRLVGMGEPMDYLPPLLAPRMPTAVWGDRIRLLGRALGVDVDDVRETVERRPLEVSVDTPTMGKFEAGGQGAARFRVEGLVAGRPRVVVEHVGRIDPTCAPDWPTASGAVGYRVLVEGDAKVEATVEPGPDGGTTDAVGRLVAAIPRVVTLPPGVHDLVDLRP